MLSLPCVTTEPSRLLRTLQRDGGVGRRGRLSRDDYARQVSAVMRHDAFKLDECATFGQMPGIQILARCLEKSVFLTGLAMRTLLDRSLHEVEMVAMHQRDTASERIAMFLHLYRPSRQAPRQRGLHRTHGMRYCLYSRVAPQRNGVCPI